MLVRSCFSLSLLAMFFVLGLSAKSEASRARVCADIFSGRVKTVVPYKRPTVQVTGVVKNAAKETFLRLTLMPRAKSWHSNFRSGPYDPQGNPRWVQLYMGDALAKILGHEFRPDEMLAPTAKTFNARIEIFNRYLVQRGIEPIPFHFYEQKQGGIERFLKNWSTRMAIPVASSMDTHTVHDVSYHYAVVLLPLPIARLLQVEAGMALQWLRASKGQPIPMTVTDSTMVIDVLSSINNVPEGQSFGHDHLRAMLTPYLSDLTNQLDETFEARWSKYAASHTPFDLFHRKLVGYKSQPPRFMDPEQELRFLKRQPRVPEIRRERDFMLKMAYLHPEWNERTLAGYGLRSLNDVQEMMNARAAELRQAARDYLAEQN